MNSHKATFPLPRIKKPRARSGASREIVAETSSGETYFIEAGLGGSVGCAVRLETRRSRVQPPSRSATFFRGD